MKTKSVGMRRAATCLLLLWYLPAAAQLPDATFERSFSVNEPIELNVSAGSGSITIVRSAAGSVRVSGELEIHERRGGFSFFGGRRNRLSDEEIAELIETFETDPPVELSAGVLTVGLVGEEWWRYGYSVDFDIEVPADTDVTSRTGSGRQRIDGVNGRIEARTGSGSVSLRDVEGRIMTRSGSGSITAENVAGEFEGRTGSGSVRLSLLGSNEAFVTTGSGSISVEGLDGGIEARAGSGSITIEGTPADSWDLTTGSGTIRIRVPPESAFDLDAHAGSGGVSTDHPLTVMGRVDRRHLSGQVRGGGPRITARSGSGGIRIE